MRKVNRDKSGPVSRNMKRRVFAKSVADYYGGSPVYQWQPSRKQGKLKQKKMQVR